MSMHKGNHVKKTTGLLCQGEAGSINVKGIVAAAEKIKDKHRSPFGFCGPKRKQG